MASSESNSGLETVPAQEALPGHVKTNFGNENPNNHPLPAIIIRGLGGHSSTPSEYQIQAEKLKSYGFECLRSTSNGQEQPQEIWLLSCLSKARGDLGKMVGSIRTADKRRKQDAALNFMMKNVSFISLDMSIQRVSIEHDKK